MTIFVTHYLYAAKEVTVLDSSRMNNLEIFKNAEFGEIRTVIENGEPWFVGKDVAEILGYSNPQRALRDYIDDDDKGVTKIVTPGGTQTMAIINESGLYSLILSSKLPNAGSLLEHTEGQQILDLLPFV